MLELMPYCGNINYALDKFEAKWGYRPTRNAVYQWAYRHEPTVVIGSALEKSPNRAQRKIYWGREPKLMEWMRQNDKGQPIPNVCQEFERDNGFRISRTQVTQWRMAYGNFSRPGRDLSKLKKPVGTRRRTKGGWLVKVRENTVVPGSKDNWEYEHHIAYRKAYGEIPEGCQVLFIDGDTDNSDPANLYAVPKKKMGVINNIGWTDRESLEFALAQAELTSAIQDAYMLPQVCRICGKEFKPWVRGVKQPKKTCKECLDKGRKYMGKTVCGTAICAVCGEEFSQHRSSDRRCGACVAARPSHCVEAHAAYFKRNGHR